MATDDFYDTQTRNLFWRDTMGRAVNRMIDEETETTIQMWKDEEDNNTPVDSNLKTLAAINKPRISDVPPVALFALGAAMSDGANKYGRFNWRQTGATSSVFYDAMQRHLAQWYDGEDFADDSKVHHLAHIMASCAILMDCEHQGSLKDDRDFSYTNPPLSKPLYWIKQNET